SSRLAEFLCFRTASRSTTARPERRPVPRIVIAGSTTPTGSSLCASYARNALTSFSVTVVRCGCAVGRWANCVMMATFCRSCSASRRVTPSSARTATAATRSAPSAMTNDERNSLCSMNFWNRATFRELYYEGCGPALPGRTAVLLGLLIGFGTVRESRARQELDFPAFHLLFEQPESRLLPDIKHLVDCIVCSTHVGRKPSVDHFEGSQPISDLRLVDRLSIYRQLAQFLQNPHALLQAFATHVLQGLESAEELGVLLVCNLELLLCLKQGIRIEHPLDFSGCDTRLLQG